MPVIPVRRAFALIVAIISVATSAQAATEKPVLYGKNWVAITGKPLAATAGAKIFFDGGNAVDATCAMLAAAATMWAVSYTHLTLPTTSP